MITRPLLFSAGMIVLVLGIGLAAAFSGIADDYVGSILAGLSVAIYWDSVGVATGQMGKKDSIGLPEWFAHAFVCVAAAAAFLLGYIDDFFGGLVGSVSVLILVAAARMVAKAAKKSEMRIGPK